ncbi:hypothetical protein L218DRAFT_1002808 [Marasmius fiardii PR-910]|nr:hypothetical protein L218DRAFT_1002808 [Marasmius fiardii PR-910]
MGTRGLIVYRYRRVKYASYNHHDSYLEGLGVDLVNEIPKPSDGEGWQDRFEKWLEKNRDVMEKAIADVTKHMSPEEVEAANVIQLSGRQTFYFNCKSEPQNDLFIEWIYEIDLDNLCFLVNNRPWYQLDNLPSEQVFLEGTDEEQSKHRYVHKIIPCPSEEDSSTLQNYSLSCTGSAPSHEILGVDETLSGVEQFRLRWVEVLVGCGRRRWETEYLDMKLEANGAVNALDAIPVRSRQRLQNLIHQIFRPHFYGEPSCEPLRTLPGCSNVYLLRKDTVFCIHNHLDNPNSLRTGSYYLFRAIMDNWTLPVSEDPFVYGVLFSGTRCVLVRVDREAGKFTHTTTMLFFPSPANMRSSAGITALARLASRIDPDYFDRFGVTKLVSSRGGLFERLPTELIDKIASFCDDFLELRDFACISTRTRDAALKASVSYIFIEDFRLSRAIDKASVSSCFDMKIFEYLEKNGSRFGLFSLETTKYGCAFCAVGFGSSVSRWYIGDAMLASRTLKSTNGVRYAMLSLEGKEVFASDKLEGR